MIIAYAILVYFGLPLVKSSLIYSQVSWIEGWGILSIILATFSYQMIVPTVCSYLKYDVQQLRKAVVLGTTIPLVVYLLWVFVVHGVVPLDGEHGLRETFAAGDSATKPLSLHLNNSILGIISDAFGFFAITTSFLGLSLALFNFLEDFFRSFRYSFSKKNIVFLTFIPTIILSILFPRALVKFLDLSGGFGDSILSCSIPVAMVWMGRYYYNLTGEYKVSGGKIGLTIAGFCAVIILFLECLKLFA
jgi:tyrosine-specific transport protein